MSTENSGDLGQAEATPSPADPYRSPRPVGGHQARWISIAVMSVVVLSFVGSVIAYSLFTSSDPIVKPVINHVVDFDDSRRAPPPDWYELEQGPEEAPAIEQALADQPQGNEEAPSPGE